MDYVHRNQSMLRAWTKSDWSPGEKHAGWRTWAPYGNANIDVIQFEDIEDQNQWQFTLRDRLVMWPNEQGVERFENSIAMSLDEIVIAVDAAVEHHAQVGPAIFGDNERLRQINNKILDIRRLNTRDYGIW